MDFVRFIALVFVLAAKLTALAAPGAGQDTAYREFIRDDRIFSDKEYYYWDKGGKVEFTVTVPDDSARVFESILRLETLDGERFNLMLSVYPGSDPEFLWIHDSEAIGLSGYKAPAADSIPLTFTFHGSKVSLSMPDTVFILPAQGLRSDQGYRIKLLSKENTAVRLSASRGWRHLSDKEDSSSLSTWFWIAIVVFVDALVFFIVQFRKRRQRRLHQQALDTRTPLVGSSSSVVFPRKNAVYLFGELRVLDRNGDDVSSRFSPLLRELFLLLLIKTPEGGITSKGLTEWLWADKDEASAKNNRSVNLHKLRTMLASIGGCRIERVDGKWQILFDENVYVDYFECLSEKMQPEKLSVDRVKILSSMTLKGGLLPSCDYIWLDQYKSRLTDNMISGLLRYASLLGENEAPETKLQICDIVLNFDSTNEAALRLKCLTYISMNKQFMAKRAYEHFCRIYSELYDEPFPKPYPDIISR